MYLILGFIFQRKLIYFEKSSNMIDICVSLKEFISNIVIKVEKVFFRWEGMWILKNWEYRRVRECTEELYSFQP